MKKNLLAVLLPVVAGVALSGTGFGLWVFNENVSQKLVGASMQVEPAINFEKEALSIESLTVTNVNGKSADDGKAIVFDQSDALDDSGDFRWTVNIEVGVTYKALLGALRAEKDVTDGLGSYREPSAAVAGYKVSELKEKLALYQVTVYSPLSPVVEKSDKGCKISDYLTSSEDKTFKLDQFSGIPTPTTEDDKDSFDSVDETQGTKITKIFTFTFTPTEEHYKKIDTADKYETFRELVKTSTFNFTAEFKKVTA